jgi:thymidylate synthase
MITFMRSNDIYLGLPHDLFSFTMLQEIVALSLDLNLGSYTHIVGSLHLYKDNIDKLDTFLEEGWQSKNNLMPEMPEGNPWPSIKKLLEAERKLRLGDLIDFDEYLMNLKLENYWVDLIKILQIFRYKKDKNFSMINSINKTISCDVYKKYIDNVLRLQK